MPKKTLIFVFLFLVIGGLSGVGLWMRSPELPEVDIEPIARRDLIAIASAPGTIQPQLSVDMSARQMGRVTRLAVEEGERVTSGQFLLEIDPVNLQTMVNRGQASVEAAEAAHEQSQVAVETARVNLTLARENLERQADLWSLRLVSREVYDQAVADVDLRESDQRAREADVAGAAQRILQERASLDAAHYDLSEVTITSPIDGIVTRRNIEQGETVVIGTMNNAGTVLLTIADMSILEAEIEVDETDVPSIQLGQQAEITIDALPDETFTGYVTEIGNSPIQTQGTGTQDATNFMVVITIDGDIPEVRPGFTCTAEITTGTRLNSLAVPIQSTTIREFSVDATGAIVRVGTSEQNGMGTANVAPIAFGNNLRVEELEGVFVVRQGIASFVPVTTGIAGERYFEALNGLTEGDLVITGPFEIVRNLNSGDPVAISESSSTGNDGWTGASGTSDSGSAFQMRIGG